MGGAMGHYVHIHVCFACDNNDPVAKLAAQYLPSIASDDDGCREARWFLEELSRRTGSNPGPKGGLSLWGIIGNYTRTSDFVQVLRPFWTDLLRGVKGGPLPFEHIVVFTEPEQSEQAQAYEIVYDEESGLLDVKHHRLPLSWHQM